MPYFLNRFFKIPYTLDIFLSSISWGALCGAFGYFLILVQADFETTGTKSLFALSLPLYTILAVLFAGVDYGSLRLFGIKKERREIRILNDNIKDQKILPGISTEKLRELFYALIERRKDWLVAVEVGVIILLSSLFTEWLASGTTTNLFIILIGGLISIFLLAVFTTFFIQYFFFSTLQECRFLLAQRGVKVKEPYSKFNELGTKFILFLLIPIMVVLMVLSFFATVNLNIIILSLIGLSMAVVISRILSSSIYRAFEGVKDFAQKLPTGKKTFFSTGSLDKEILDLSTGLNKAADEVYIAKRELEEERISLEIKVKARTKELDELNKSLEGKIKERTKEIQGRVTELERFRRLVVGRELKMVELKKEIEKMEEEFEKDNL